MQKPTLHFGIAPTFKSNLPPQPAPKPTGNDIVKAIRSGK